MAKISNRIILTIYLLSSVMISVYYYVKEDYVNMVLGPVSLLYLLIPPVAEFLFRMKLPLQVRNYIYAFVIFAFHFGVAFELYNKTGFYDIAAHILSGVIFTAIGLCFYLSMSKESVCGEVKNYLIPLTYAFFFSMFVAVLWETGEFIGYLATGRDLQHHLDTGVFDTMEDLISCIIGSLFLILDYFLYIKKGFTGVIATSVKPFEDSNL